MKARLVKSLMVRVLSVMLATIGFALPYGIVGDTVQEVHAAKVTKRVINRYWTGYYFGNGNWQFIYQDSRVKGAGTYWNGKWSIFYGYDKTGRSYVRNPGEWDYKHTIYGTPGARIK